MKASLIIHFHYFSTCCRREWWLKSHLLLCSMEENHTGLKQPNLSPIIIAAFLKIQQKTCITWWEYLQFIPTCICFVHNVTLDHKTSLKCQFFDIEMYTSYESWIDRLSIDVWFVGIEQHLAEIKVSQNLRVQKKKNIEKISFKICPNEILAMHITNQKWSFDIFTVENFQNIFMEHT